MKLSKLATLGIIAATVVTACKYEEGPRISLRAKRDRVANEWSIKTLTVGDNDSNILNSVNDTATQFNNGFEVLINLYRTGSYNADVYRHYKDDQGNIKYETQQEGFGKYKPDAMQWNRIQFDNFCKNLPEVIARIQGAGKWSFDKGHYKLQIKPELSWVDTLVTAQKNTIDWDIVLLKEKTMKLKTRDSKDKVYKMELSRINEEPYWF